MKVYVDENKRMSFVVISLSFLLLAIVDVFLVITKPDIMLHWFLITITISGLLLLPDCIRFFVSRYDLFDPKAHIVLSGMYFFYIAPIIFIYNEMQMPFVNNPPDWRNWVGIFGGLNSVGLLIFKFINNNIFWGNINKKKCQFSWELVYGRFFFWSMVFIVIGIISQIYIFVRVGGINGFMLEASDETGKLDGAGWILMFGESVPILFMFLLTYVYKNKNSKKNNIMILTVMFLFFLLQFFIAGLRGSRSTTIFALFWALGIIHYCWKPIKKRTVFIMAIPLLFFMVIYGYYKNVGPEIVDYFKGNVTFEEIQSKAPSRGFLNTLVGDLSRVDAQSYAIYRLLEFPDQYSLAWGRTYIGDVSILVPRAIWPNRPPTKTKEGTELYYGMETYEPNEFQTSRVFGLVGEGLLNFHFVGIPFLFFVWSALVMKLRKLMVLLPKNDARWFVIPLLIQLSFTSLNSDLDNIIFGLVKNGLVPFLVIYLSSKKVKNKNEFCGAS